MSRTEQILLAENPKLEENEDDEELLTVNDVTDNGQRRDQNSSTPRRRRQPWKMLALLMRAFQRGSSLKSLRFQETKLEDLDLTETDSRNRNVYHYAVLKPATLKQILKKFGKKSCAQEDPLCQADYRGNTPIHRAAVIANIESLEILLEYDNSLMKLKTAISKRSVLHMAVRSRSMVAVEFVLNKDPDLVNGVDNMLQTPLHYAACLKQPNILELLFSMNAEVKLKDKNGQLALHIAAKNGLKTSVQLLLRANPDIIDNKDDNDQTPLLLAAKNNFPCVVSYLLSKEADYEIRDKTNGLSAFDWAVSSKSIEVVKVFLDNKVWKKVVSSSRNGPEQCLAKMIESMPEMAKMLLDKCVSTKVTKPKPTGDNEVNEVVYDFFCLIQSDENGGSGPGYAALNALVENENEDCICHPVVVKYVDKKWLKRGFKYSLASIIVNLIFHICLITYTRLVIGEVVEVVGKNVTKCNDQSVPRVFTRKSTSPDAPVVMVLRVILLIITCGTILKELFQIKVQGMGYFTMGCHYAVLAMRIIIFLYLLPVSGELSATHIGSGSIAVLYSWITLLQYLKVLPVIGIYIIVVHKVFWTLMKVLIVVSIYLLSFSTTFYVLLTEHDGFRSMYMSTVSTFVAMTSGFDYDKHFVSYGWYEEIYDIKLVVLILFVLVMSIVVNNALIGLAVGDTDEVMKYARFDKYKRRVQFVIHLEKSVNNISFLRVNEEKAHAEFPQREKCLRQKILHLLYFGSKIDAVAPSSDEVEDEYYHEMETTLEDHIDKAIDIKLENLRLSLRNDLQGIHNRITEDRNDLQDKMGMIFDKLK